MKFFLLLFILCSLSGSLLAENHKIPVTGSKTVTVSSGDIFFDSGGNNGNYSSNESGVITFNSAEGTVIRVTFTEFQVQNGGSNDYLNAYDGVALSALIGNYYGTYATAPARPNIITSTGNLLTFSFKSSNYSNYTGWKATIEVLNENEAFCFPSINNVGWGNNQYISNVLIGDIDNSTGSNEYSDYTDSFSTDVEVGTNYILNVTNGITYKEEDVCNVWIDWNQDGDFDDSDETVITSATFVKGKELNYSTIITPSSNAVSGKVRMRVRISENGATDCETTDWGEVEDYTLHVVSSGLSVDLAKAFDESCSGANDGVIQFYESTPAIDSGLDFSIDGGGTWQSEPVFTGVSVGSYNLRIRNAGGGINSVNYPLSVDVASNITIGKDNIQKANCGIADGSIDVTVSGGRNGSLQTDGSTGMVDLQTSFLTGLNAFTMEGWVKLNDARSTYSGQRSFFGQNDVIEFGFENGYYTCWTANGGKVRTNISNYPDDQAWHHVAVVGTGASLTLYIDGGVVQILNRTIGSSTYGTNGSYTVQIGAGVWNSGDLGEPFNGVFTDVRFWKDARTTSEIQNNMTQSLNGDEEGLIAVYKMDSPPEGDKTYGIGSEATVGIINSGASWIDTDPVYFYSWIGPDGFVSSDEDLIDLSAGSYVLTVTDLNACSVSESIIVGVDDVVDPIRPTLVDLSGECSVTAVVPTTTDACSGVITGTTADALTYTTQGTHTITWNFDDGNGNAIDAIQNVLIDDITNPVTPILADLTGECAITAPVPTTTDACAGVVLGTTTDALTYTTQGTHTITWNFDDGNGNAINVSQNVIIEDITSPVFQDAPTDIAINSSGDACGEIVNYTMPSATDNCSAYTGTLAGFAYLGELDNHTYYYSDGTATAIDAMSVASNLGGHLVSITSQAENDFIDYRVGDVWIGLTDATNEGTFVWSDGEALVYSNWNGVEPNNSGNEDYVQMYSYGKWNDLSSNYNKRYVVEFEGALVTQTAGLPSGSLFPIGTTLNTFEATDNAGNIVTHSFNVTVSDVSPPKIAALQAEYYDGIDFATFKETLPVDELDYDWGYNPPESDLVGNEYFSIRFTGYVQAVQAGTYTFYTTSDDGVRLWVAGQSVINNWTDHGRALNSGTISLTAGQIAPITLEFYERTGAAIIKLEWEGPGVSRQFVSSNGSGTGLCEDVAVDVSVTGFYDLTVDEADPGYTDECGIASRILSQTHFTCGDLGANSVTLTVQDIHGNSANCVFDVIVTGAPANDLTVLGDTECVGSNANLTIESSESGIVYSAYKDGVQIGSSVTGDGSDLSVTVPTTGFLEGNNIINFKAQSGACISDLTNTAIVIIEGIPTPLGIYHE